MDNTPTTLPTPVQTTIQNYMAEKRLTFRALAAQLSDVLATRSIPPKSISHAQVFLWTSGINRPNPFMFEYIRDHGPAELAQFASQVLAAMQPEPQPEPSPTE